MNKILLFSVAFAFAGLKAVAVRGNAGATMQKTYTAPAKSYTAPAPMNQVSAQSSSVAAKTNTAVVAAQSVIPAQSQVSITSTNNQEQVNANLNGRIAGLETRISSLERTVFGQPNTPVVAAAAIQAPAAQPAKKTLSTKIKNLFK